MPPDGLANSLVNPFHSEKTQTEYLLQATRPMNLPDDTGMPIRDTTGLAPPRSLMSEAPTGKGRGCQTAGAMPAATEPTVAGTGNMQTEGRLPGVEKLGDPEVSLQGDDLQRALEVEMLDYLRGENSKLADEVAFLKGQLKLKSVGNTASGVASSPWSAIDGSGSLGSFGTAKVSPMNRPGRNGSRTPRNKNRNDAVSPENEKINGFTPGGTKVPEGPPPPDPVMPPVPPIPMVAEGHGGDAQVCSSFVSGLYDTCESKPRGKLGDSQWKPRGDPDDEGVLSAREAKQVWLEREVRSLKFALDRVAVPAQLQQSGYWTSGFDGPSTKPRGLPAADCTAHDQLHDRALHLREHGGHLDQARALHASEHGGHLGRARALHGEHLDQVRASGMHGAHLGEVRASSMHGAHLGEVRASSMHGAHLGDGRAFGSHGDHRGDGRAFGMSGDHLGNDRAFDVHGALPERDRASGMDVGVNGLHHKDPQGFCPHPRHGVGGGGVGDGMRPIQQWPENAGTTMNTKGELPELPANSSPLQFGDWLHLIAPSMKGISSVAGWWWENTFREAQCYYAQWKESSPLQRIRIQPTLPDAIKEHQFQRTEQRGIQMLLKAIPETEQQALVTERALSTTAIIYRLLIRFQPGGAGEKQILLQQLTTMPKAADVQELASNLRNWRRHFGRAQEVEAVLPDGILLLKALDQPLQQLGTLDPQAAFRLSQSRMQLQLDQQPSHNNLWAFSQCLLAEAETLALLQTSTATPTSTPIKIKQLEAPGKTSPGDTKSKLSPMSDKPCRFFQSDAGCKAGKACKWQHSWASDADKASRCFVCGSKEHRKVDCPVKANGKKPGEPFGSGGGNGQGQGRGSGPTSSSTTTSGSNVGGKAGAAAAKVINAAGGKAANEKKEEAQGIQKEGGGSTGSTDGTSSAMTANDGKPSGGSEVESHATKNDKTAELLHEATQLLKTLRVPAANPHLKVMQIGGLDQAGDGMVLLDSGATHGLRSRSS